MADNRHDRDKRPSPDALLAAARREGRPTGTAEDLPRCGPRRRQDLRDADDGAGQDARGPRRRGGRGRDAWPQRDGSARRGFGRAAAPQGRLQGRRARGDGSRRSRRTPSADRPHRRTRPLQCAGQPPPEALPGRRGGAGGRHRRLHDLEHPARREPQRRRGPDHARPGPRDGAGLDPRPGRRHRDHRYRARRPAAALEGGQDLPAPSGRARPGGTSSRPATSRPCGSSRCAAPRSASTTSSSRICRPMPSRDPGRQASGSWCASARTRAARGSSATPSASPIVCARPGSRFRSRAGAVCRSATSSATASPTRCASPTGSGAKPSPCRAPDGASPTMSSPMRGTATSPIS